MLRRFKKGVGGAHVAKVFVFVPMVVFAVSAWLGVSSAQVPDQLQQLQQQYQQRQGQAAVPAEANLPQNLILQPDAMLVQQPLPVSRLEQIQSKRVGVRLRQFGYDQLGHAAQVVVPQTGAVLDDYILGPGDEIVVSLRGQENNDFRTTVDRNGQVVLPRLSPIAASGRTFGSFRSDLQMSVHRSFVATEATVSVGRMRQISVLVSGEVNNPGSRLVTGLSSAVDALLLSGGVKKTGSLRAVRIQRGAHVYVVDLYSVLTADGAGSVMRLADGDRIVVPPLGRTVAVAGLVRRPGIFELAAGQAAMPVKTLMALAGGLEVRGRYRLSVIRINAQGSTEMEALAGEVGLVHDSEILSVQLGADQATGQATLSGVTGLAGAYPIVTGTKLSDVLRAPGAMGASPYTPFGLIVRKDPVTLMPVLMSFTPVAVLNGREDEVLQSGDVVRVFSTNEIRLLNYDVQTYLQSLNERQAAIRNPLSQTTSSQNAAANVASLVASQSGQAEEIANIASVPANVQREQVIRLLDTAAPGSILASQRAEDAQRRQRMLQQGQRQNALSSRLQSQNAANLQTLNNTPTLDNQQAQGSLQTQDNPQVLGDPQAQDNGQSTGNVQDDQYSSQVSDIGLARNFSEQVQDPGGFATNREVETFGQLARQITVDPLILINFLVDNRALLDGAVRGPGYYFVGPSASLDDVVRAAGGTVNWADESGVELITTAVNRQTGRSATQRNTLPLHQGTLASYVVRPGDQVRFSQVYTDVGAGTVTVQGEVRFPGAFPIMRGEHLSELLARAGGLTGVAYPYGTVFLRRSAAQMERDGYNRAANEVQSQLVVAMTRIGNNKIDPQTFASMQTFVTELRNQQALGRISISADPSVLAANPAQDPLLEAGDVIYIPQRPSTISVLGQVLQPGSYPYKAGVSLKDYIARAGGYSVTADESQTFVVLPDGSARRIDRSWLSFEAENLPPGSAIVVPRDVTPLDLRQTIIDISQIFSQFAVAIASVAVLSKQ